LVVVVAVVAVVVVVVVAVGVVAVVVGVVAVVVAFGVVVSLHGAEVVWALRVVWILRVVKLFHCILAVELSSSPLVVELSLMMVKLFLVGILVHKMMVGFFLVVILFSLDFFLEVSDPRMVLRLSLDFFPGFSLEVSLARTMIELPTWVKLFF